MILIIGATGLVGGAVLSQLAARGIDVRALVRSPAQAAALTAPGVETVLGDLAQPTSLDAALHGVTRALLLSPHHPQQVTLQGNFVAAARRAGRVHIVKLSGLGTALDSPLHSGRWHAQIEQAVVEADLPYTFLRPLFFMQNLLRAAAEVAAHGVLAAAMQDGCIAMVDARDVAAVAVAALTSPGHVGHTYTITGPEALSYADIATTLTAATGSTVLYRDLSLADMRQQLRESGLPEWLINVRMEFAALLRASYAAEVSDTVYRVTGQAPRTFAAFAREHAGLFRRTPA
ncbi:MAG: SDR family oxidoreductase [Candidatus Tectimicrobiota bacterium]